MKKKKKMNAALIRTNSLQPFHIFEHWFWWRSTQESICIFLVTKENETNFLQNATLLLFLTVEILLYHHL